MPEAAWPAHHTSLDHHRSNTHTTAPCAPPVLPLTLPVGRDRRRFTAPRHGKPAGSWPPYHHGARGRLTVVALCGDGGQSPTAIPRVQGPRSPFWRAFHQLEFPGAHPHFPSTPPLHLQVLFLAAKDVKSSKALQLGIAVVNAIQLWIFPLRLITTVRQRPPPPAPDHTSPTLPCTFPMCDSQIARTERESLLPPRWAVPLQPTCAELPHTPPPSLPAQRPW